MSAASRGNPQPKNAETGSRRQMEAFTSRVRNKPGHSGYRSDGDANLNLQAGSVTNAGPAHAWPSCNRQLTQLVAASHVHRPLSLDCQHG